MNSLLLSKKTPIQRLVHLKRISGGGGSSSKRKTVSGALVHITDALAEPFIKIEANIDPVQNLHGYGYPWAPGMGVNKADLTGATAYTDGTYGMYVTVDTTNEIITMSGTWTGSGATGMWRFLTVPNIANGLGLKAFELTNGSHITDFRWDGSNRRWVIGVKNMVKDAEFTIKFKVVAYDGSTAPSTWTPYSNVCPISGNTGTKVYHSGADTSDYDTYSYTFPAGAGVVYGATINVTSGVLKVTDVNIASYNGETLPGAWISSMDAYEEGTTPTTGAQVVYKLAEPIEYQLTGAEITAHLGENSLWADDGDIKVTYKASA